MLTPHEGELARLLGTTAAEVAAQRLALRPARRPGAAARPCCSRATRTIVADPDGTAFVVPTGNPGLATPGTGDVLTGIIAGQLAKGLPATEAACLGGYVHGLAADLAAEDAVSTEGMIASDLFDFLPLAVERLVLGDDEDTTTMTTTTDHDRRDGEQVSEDERDERWTRRGERRRAQRGPPRAAGDDPRVADIMERDVVTIAPDATVHELVLLLRDKDLGGVPVVDGDGRLVGIVTEGDLVIEDADVRLPHYFELFDNLIYLGSQKKFKERLKKMVGNAVADVMTTEVFTVGSRRPGRARRQHHGRQEGQPRAGGRRDDRLVGIVTRHDIIRMLGL